MDSNTELAAELKAAIDECERSIARGVQREFSEGFHHFAAVAWSNREEVMDALTQPAEQTADGAVGVTQRDREAAGPYASCLSDMQDIFDGKADGLPVVQAFARHAQQARAQALEEAAKVAEAYAKRWQSDADKLQTTNDFHNGGYECATSVATAIRALNEQGGGV